MNEFKAEVINGKLVIKPIIIKKGKDVIVKLPSLQIINEFQSKLKEDNNGEWNIQ